MSKTPLFFIFILLSLCLPANNAAPLPHFNFIKKQKNAPKAWQLEMLQMVNKIRTAGCHCGNKKMPPAPPLKWNDQLAKAAHGHAVDMDKNRFIGHFGTDGSRIGQRVDRAGYNWQNVAENASWNTRTVEESVLGWKDSPGHCRNMMGRVYKELGVARVGAHWVQVFASPMK